MPRDPEFLARQLRDKLPGYAALQRVVPVAAGYSNETYLLEGMDRVLRMPPSGQGLLPPYDMALQHAVFAAVGRCAEGPPVPRVFELGTDTALLGDSYYIMARLPGASFEATLPAWIVEGGPAACGRVCEQWIDAVVRVARVPYAGIPLPRRTPREEAQYWLGLAAGAAAPRALIALLEGLVAAPPRESGPATLVHGDAKFGNCMWHEGRLVGLLDWEMASIGDPLADLGYLLSYFNTGRLEGALASFQNEGWWSRARMAAAWEAGTGRRALDVHLYEALAMCKLSAIRALGLAHYRAGRIEDPRLASWADFQPKFIAAIQRRLDAGSAAG